MGTINFKGKAARVPLKENFWRNFFVKKFFKLCKTVKKVNVLICRYMKFYALILCENVTLEKSGADLAAALFLSARAGRERNLRA